MISKERVPERPQIFRQLQPCFGKSWLFLLSPLPLPNMRDDQQIHLKFSAHKVVVHPLFYFRLSSLTMRAGLVYLNNSPARTASRSTSTISHHVSHYHPIQLPQQPEITIY
jgi:hypothetical protein